MNPYDPPKASSNVSPDDAEILMSVRYSGWCRVFLFAMSAVLLALAVLFSAYGSKEILVSAGLVFTTGLSLGAAFKLRKHVLFHVFPDRIEVLPIWESEAPRKWRLESMDMKFATLCWFADRQDMANFLSWRSSSLTRSPAENSA